MNDSSEPPPSVSRSQLPLAQFDAVDDGEPIAVRQASEVPGAEGRVAPARRAAVVAVEHEEAAGVEGVDDVRGVAAPREAGADGRGQERAVEEAPRRRVGHEGVLEVGVRRVDALDAVAAAEQHVARELGRLDERAHVGPRLADVGAAALEVGGVRGGGVVGRPAPEAEERWTRLVLDDLVDDTPRLRLRVDGDPPHAEVGEDVQEELRVVRVAPVGAGRRVAAARAGVGHGAVPVGPRRRHELGVAQQQHVGRAHDARVVAALDERVDRGAGRVRGSSPDLAHARGDPFRGLPGGEAVGRRSEAVVRQDQELLAQQGRMPMSLMST